MAPGFAPKAFRLFLCMKEGCSFLYTILQATQVVTLVPW